MGLAVASDIEAMRAEVADMIASLDERIVRLNTLTKQGASHPADSAKMAEGWPYWSILVVDDEPGMRNFLVKTLGPRCQTVHEAGSAEDGAAREASVMGAQSSGNPLSGRAPSDATRRAEWRPCRRRMAKPLAYASDKRYHLVSCNIPGKPCPGS